AACKVALGGWVHPPPAPQPPLKVFEKNNPPMGGVFLFPPPPLKSPHNEKEEKMKGKIGLEEHFAIEDTVMDSKGFFPDDIWKEVRERVLDLHGRRLKLMDEFGLEMMILSLNAPAIQAIVDSKKANEIARKANDYLAEQVKKRPDRFQALAALPLQDPDLAARELQRCVKELGM